MYITKVLQIHKNNIRAETSILGPTNTETLAIRDFMMTNNNNKISSWHCLQTNSQIINNSLADALTSITVGSTKYLSESGTIK